MTQHESAREAFFDALLDDDPEQLYDRAPCGYLSTSPDGRIVKVNQTLLTWTGYERDELLQRSFVDLLTPGGRLYHETHYAPMLRLQAAVREIALDVVRADGQRIPVLVNANLEIDEAGEPVVVRIVLFDATERRTYERELLRARQQAEASERQARELAHTLQRTLLPPKEPAIPELDIAATFQPAGDTLEIGGDFYDVFQVAEGDWVAIIGDVCGKGVEAAILTALIRDTLRAVVVGMHEPSKALSALNEVLVHHETDRFCTLVMVRMQHGAEGWTAAISSGGHPRPLLIGPGRNREEVGGQGPLVGVLDAPEFRDERVALRPGDALVLFTDGVTESRDGAAFYGDARLREVLGRPFESARSVVDAVFEDVVAYSGGPTRDDVAVVVMRVPERS
ncbi:PAS domain S-box protein [Aeromicrobium phragmitis]|uniref:PAS domain S-box protein n=1 Tax=Aeromicrobium phragmitis TaxID=2478914 RepID=A0A3L8PQP5_9ACTN|nr:SpoIIE family protein phosphatase [Aeromicrobium phragmitis]RLV57179.1 PAS domain S-box protein [Aeromicrobium phragmitis]